MSDGRKRRDAPVRANNSPIEYQAQDEQQMSNEMVAEFKRRCREQGIQVDVAAGR
jgi:hypothetical protein